MPWLPTTPERDALVARLHHPDVAQLLFQVSEIFDDRIYLRHGIHVEPGATVLDVGANIGISAVFFQHECGASVVHSFEPVPATFELLERNVAGFPGCVAHGYGLSDSARAATIAYYPRADGMSTLYEDRAQDERLVRTVMTGMGLADDDINRRLEGRYDAIALGVELRTLASVFVDLGLEDVDLVKIDVERSELDVLYGMADGDWPKIRQVVAEVHDANFDRFTMFLKVRGFTVETDQELPGLSMVYAKKPRP